MAIYESHLYYRVKIKKKYKKRSSTWHIPVDFYHRVDEGDSPRNAEWIWYNSSVLLD